MLCNDCRGDLITQRAHRRGRRTNEDDLLGGSSQSFGKSGVLGCVAPTSPDGMDIHSLGHIDDQLDVRIIVVICASGYLKNGEKKTLTIWLPSSARLATAYLHILIGHTNVIGVCPQILRCGHDRELNGPFVAECLVGPFPNRPNLLDSCDTIVGNEHLFNRPNHISKSARIATQGYFLKTAETATYRTNDGVTLMAGNEILYTAWRCCVQVISTDEM